MEQRGTSAGATVIPLARPSESSSGDRRRGDRHGPLRTAKVSPFVAHRWDGAPGSEWRHGGGQDRHTADLAHVRYLPDGSRIETWYRGSRLNRVDGPAVIERAASGRILNQEWWIDGRNITDVAEAYVRETGARCPLDPGHQSLLLCRQLVGGGGTAMFADSLGWRSILTALCYVGPFWALLGLSITLLR